MMLPLNPNSTLLMVRRWIQHGVMLWYGIAGVIGLMSGTCFAQSPAPTNPSNTASPTTAQVDRQVIVDLVSKLAADNFTTREIAKAKLLELGSGIIAVLDENLAEADVDASTQIFEIYSQFALDPQSEATSQVVKSLKKLIATETSRNSILAAQLLE